MRVVGDVDSHLGLGLSDHLCWVHDDLQEYRAALTGFFAEGLARGLRVMYAGSGTVGKLREHLDGLADLDHHLARDAVRIVSFDEIYGVGAPVDPAAIVGTYAVATAEAMADGYRGLRASADVTDVARTAEQQDAFARYEFLLERYSARHPLSAMCAYNSELGSAVRRFAALHPAAPAGLTQLRLFACDDGAIGVAGDAELACVAELERALEHVTATASEPDVVVDLSLVTFVDHQALLALSAFARRSQVRILFRSVPAIAQRVAGLLSLELPSQQGMTL